MRYDSPRMEAAMKALREDLDNPFHATPRHAATIALRAADKAMFTDEAVERAAKALHDLGATALKWEERDEDLKELYREDARTAFAVLLEDA